MRRLSLMTVAACAVLMFGTAVDAQQPIAAAAPPAAPPPYGEPITLELAKKIAAAAEAEAKKLNLNATIAIVEPMGRWSISRRWTEPNIAEAMWLSTRPHPRRFSAVRRRRLTPNSGPAQTYLLTLRGMNAVPGGIPIVVNGKLIGGIGVSGGSGPQDVQVAEAGIAGLK